MFLGYGMEWLSSAEARRLVADRAVLSGRIATSEDFRGPLRKKKPLGHGRCLCACMHVVLYLCISVERGAAGTGEGMPAWRRGVCGLGVLLTS
jgi:hypothetical protein